MDNAEQRVDNADYVENIGILCSSYEMTIEWIGGAGGLHATLWPENFCPLTRLQRNTDTLE